MNRTMCRFVSSSVL